MQLLIDIGFLPFRFLDLLDILLVTLLLYVLFKLVRGTIALNISIGIASIFFIWWLVRALDMRLVSGILGQFIEVGVIALLIVFQQEIRRVLLIIGRNMRVREGAGWQTLLPWNWDLKENYQTAINEIVQAARKLSTEKTGAIMVISRGSDLRNFTATGVEIRSSVKTELLVSIFQKTTPLHDGAVIVANELLVAASCILPVSQNRELPRSFGTRHRAAIGLTEQTDAIAVVVSEENGSISYSVGGKIYSFLTPEELHEALEKELKRDNKQASMAEREPKGRRANSSEKGGVPETTEG